MAEAAFPTPSHRVSWLDRSLVPNRAVIAWVIAHQEILLYSAITVAGFLLRIWDVGARAVHHDESLHAYYSWQFYTGAGYQYDPLMHGPLQFEVVPLFYLLFGVSDMSARLFAVGLGTVLIFLPFFLRSHLTRAGALLASLMIAISPALVYYSRFIRDDIYLACFTLLLFIALVRYVESPRPAYLYVGAVAVALAVASMEAAYLTIFIFGTFLLVEALREAVSGGGPLLRSIRATSLDTWLTAISIFVVLTVLFYSTFFTNPYGIWDTQHNLLSPDRKDILGGLTYWQAQHAYHRGDEPWYYYMLLLPLYEQLALVLGAAGIVYAAVRRTFTRTFLAWWAVMAFALYSWAGEKMPWLVIHIALPLILLAGLFVGEIVRTRNVWPRVAVAAIFILGALVEIHSTFLLNFVDGANPTEMLIYVQTSNDVKHVAAEVGTISRKLTGSKTLHIGLDTNDVGGWPFTWYLRDYPHVTDATSFSGPVCNGQYCPVLIMLGPEYDASQATLMQHYVVQKYRWNWWFPQDYMTWFPQHWSMVPQALQGRGSLLADLVGTPTDWHHVWNWFVYRTPFGPRDARWLYFLVRRDLVPGASQYSSGQVSGGLRPVASMSGNAAQHLDAPRGIATDSHGDVFVADSLNHRVVGFDSTGRPTLAIGRAGTAPGLFSQRDSPQGVAVGPDGDLYVADTWNQRIEVFSPTGRFLRSWSKGFGTGPGQFYGPRSLAVAPNGNVYVADTGNKRVQVFSSTGRFLFSWGGPGSAPGQFNEPSSVAVARSGLVYVADFWNQRIQVFNAHGQYRFSWPVATWTTGTYEEPYLAIAPNGDVVASNPSSANVLEFTPRGAPVRTVRVQGITDPIGVAIRPDGTVAVSDPVANIVDLVPTGRSIAPRTATPAKTPVRP